MHESDEDLPEDGFLGDDLTEYREALREWASAHPSEFWYQVARMLLLAKVREAPYENPHSVRVVLRWNLADPRPRSALRASPYRCEDGDLAVGVWLQRPEPGKVSLQHGPLERFDSFPD